jgi:hypothetical protein
MARPTKLTPKVAQAICKVLKEGAYIETAAEAAGISVQTLYNWLDRGAVSEKPYAAFLEAVMRARAEGELALFRRAKRGDSKGVSFGGGRAAAFILERTRPNRYAQRVNLRVEDAVREVLEVVRGICSPEDFARILARLEAVDREGSEELPAPDPGGPGSPLH